MFYREKNIHMYIDVGIYIHTCVLAPPLKSHKCLGVVEIQLHSIRLWILRAGAVGSAALCEWLIILFICTSFYTIQAICFTVSDNLVFLSQPPHPSPTSITFIFAKSGLLNSSGKQGSPHQFLTHQTPFVASVPNLSWSIDFRHKALFFHILPKKKKMQIVGTLRPIFRLMF